MAKKKLIRCKACDAEIAASAKSCPHCGAKNKKPFYKKAWFWILVVVLLIGFAGGDEDTSDVPSPTATTVATSVTEPPTKTILPVETTVTTIETTVATEATVDPTKSDKVSADIVAALIEANAAENFTHYDISHDETGITLNVWEDGLSAGAVLAASGSSEHLSLWNGMVDNIENMGDAMYDFAATCGREDLLISVNVLNDTNTDNLLIMVMNGTVVYDAVNDG